MTILERDQRTVLGAGTATGVATLGVAGHGRPVAGQNRWWRPHQVDLALVSE
jgi:hypothetical protein